jgi:hypothetical protein
MKMGTVGFLCHEKLQFCNLGLQNYENKIGVEELKIITTKKVQKK